MSRSHPLRIVLASTARQWHGGELQAHLLARGLRAAGHYCSIIARQGSVFAQRLAEDAFEVWPLASRHCTPAGLLRVRSHLARLRPDVLHFNDAGALTRVGLAAVGLPIVVRLAARRVDFPLRSLWPYKYLCDRVICVSESVARVCQQSGLGRRQLRVVHDGVDVAQMLQGDRQRGRQVLAVAEDQPLLLTVANLTDHKGHRYLLAALPELLTKYPNLQLALAGDGDQREALGEQAERLGVANSVLFLGYRSDVPDLMAACDIFVMPSHLEGLCSSVIDAMLARRPIVATTAGGIPELVGSHGHQPAVARLVPPRDPAQLAGAVRAALEAPSHSAWLAERAAQRARRRFTAQLMVLRTLAVYEQVRLRINPAQLSRNPGESRIYAQA